MIKIKLSEETRYGLIFVFSLLGVLAVMLLANSFLGKNEKSTDAEKVKEKTVIVTEAKKNATPSKPPPKSVVTTVRDALKQGNYSTAFMEINNVSTSSPEYEELRKQLDSETQKRKTPGVRKDAGASPSTPVRYLDESTPRNRSADAIYIYFVDVSGTLIPRFCIQVAAKRPQGITRFVITADSKNIDIAASPLQFENTEKGVAEWYDAPLDRRGYDAVQAMLKAKKATLTVIGSKGKNTRDVTDNEKKGFRHILDGYAALGGTLNYLQDTKAVPATPLKKRP